MKIKREICNFVDFKKKILLEGEKALNEINNGKKESHWMWYFFPQLEDLGTSYMSKYYGIKSLREAKYFLQDKILRKFLVKITLLVYKHIINKKKTLKQIFGNIDSHKFLSCMTLFYYAAKLLDNEKLTNLFKFCKKIAELELEKKDIKTYKILFE